jgi:dihydroorotate dehydrogenase electron transfer subunit
MLEEDREKNLTKRSNAKSINAKTSEEDQENNLNNLPSPESIKAKASNEFLPDRLRDLCAQLDWKEIKQQVENLKRNTQAYHSLCLALATIMLQRDAWEIVYANPAEFEEGAFGKDKDRITPESTDYGTAAFVARKADREILFFFGDHVAEPLRLAEAARQISKLDREQYKMIAVLILPSAKKMERWRTADRADNWPRGFFIPLDELREKCKEAAPEAYGALCRPIARTVESAEPDNRAAMFRAEVQQNVPVGGKRASHYKLRFRASNLTSIMPGQFIMMDTLPRNPRKSRGPVSWDVFKLSYGRAPQTYLKRPFGVHRAFYPHFGNGYLGRLALPRSLATVMHTVLPNAFDIFYKVLPNGKGTHEMSQLCPPTAVNMIGPLGRRFDLRQEVSEGLEEVHVIGGGVGMAPLIFLVQSLRYFGISVKAFIGIESVDMLKYRGDLIDEGFAVGAKDAYIYVDDLKETGVDCSDIYVSCDKESHVRELVQESNYRTGLVSQQYEEFLSINPKRNNVVAFACGPIPMMSAVNDITKTHGVHLRVFMEKRMACGIGVCLSCVCKTTAPGSGYSRVCKEGPIFEASEIIWD